MERIPPKLYPALVNEIAAWHKEDLISATLAEKLVARYPASQGKSNAVTLFTIIGAVLIGLGTLLYIGANWQAMATVWKLLIIVAAITGSSIAGWIFKFEPGSRPKLGTALLLLGSLFYGAGIWLVAQMFNLDVDFPYGLLLWFAGCAGSAIVTRSSQVGILASLVLGWWTLYSHNSLLNCNPDVSGDFGIVASTLVGISLAWHLRSQAMSWITLVATSLWISVASGTHFAGLLFWGFGLFGAYLWSREHWQLGSKALKYVSTSSALTAIIWLTCDRTALLSQLNLVNCLGLLGGAVAMHLVLLTKFRKYRNEAIACLLLLAYFLIFAFCPVELDRVVAFNLMTILCVFGLGLAGTKQLQSPGIVNTAIVFTVIFIICRYFDLFFSMMDRSLFFIVGGVVLMMIGALAEGSRRRLLGSMT